MSWAILPRKMVCGSYEDELNGSLRFPGGMYLPFELFQLIREITWARVMVFLVNAAIVVYLGRDLYQSGMND